MRARPDCRPRRVSSRKLAWRFVGERRLESRERNKASWHRRDCLEFIRGSAPSRKISTPRVCPARSSRLPTAARPFYLMHNWLAFLQQIFVTMKNEKKRRNFRNKIKALEEPWKYEPTLTSIYFHPFYTNYLEKLHSFSKDVICYTYLDWYVIVPARRICSTCFYFYLELCCCFGNNIYLHNL